MFFVVISCQSHPGNADSKESSFSDHLAINDKNQVIEIRENCVVIIYPDSNLVQKTEKNQKEYDENGVDEATSNDVRYLNLIKEHFQQKGIRIIETNKPTILFVNDKGEKTKIENYFPNTRVLVYAFNTHKSPLKMENLIGFSNSTDNLKDWDNYFDIE